MPDARLRMNHQHAIGMSRRELLQVGYSGLVGVGLSQVSGQRADAAN